MLTLCFGALRTIWVHLGEFGCVTTLSAKWANLVKSSCHEVESEFFVMSAPDPPHWPLNSRFGVFRTLWMNLGPFGCRTKLGAKLVEVVQKFVP